MEAMANNSIDLSTLDYDTIKANLKNHLRSQQIFKDYDFDGSNISVILGLLAYNTALNAHYMNMLSSESFLDSAQLRSSVVSHAKELNYRPRSARSAKATVRIFAEQNNSNVLTIPKGTTFTATYNFQTFTFATNEIKAYFAAQNSGTGTYIFDTGNIDIYEGFYITENFIMDSTNENLRFILSNPMIDTTSLIVNSIENGSTVVNYALSDTLLGLESQSAKYFLQAAEDDKYEVLFGDDIIGRRPPDGAVIQIQYRISSGALPNGANVFTMDQDVTTDNSGRIVIQTVTKAIGGAESESIASIKFNAPRHFQTQQRAITEFDYNTLLKTEFPEINALSVYGGETITPPQYGKVFIAVAIDEVDGIPQSKKDDYYTFIKSRMAGPIKPVFVSPNYLYVRVDTNVKYNLNVTSLRPDEIRLLVASQIASYNSDNLSNFNATLYNSKFVRAIDDAHNSVISNETKTYVYRKTKPLLDTPQNLDISFSVPIRSDIPEIQIEHDNNELKAVFSSPFTLNDETCVIEDDGVGGLRIMRASGNSYTKIQDVGTVDYDNGTLQLKSFTLQSYDGQSLRFYAIPASADISASKNDLLQIELDEANINVKVVRE
jgi:hypothetical protein